MNSELGIRNVGCVLALVMTFFTACTDYQEQFDNNFAALEYGDIENPELSSGFVPGSSGGSTTKSSAFVPASSGAEQLSSGVVPTSSGAEPLSSGTVPTQSSGEQPSSSAESSSSVESSSSSIVPMSSYTPPSGMEYGELVYKGQKYRIVKIENQVWMAENMNAVVDGSSCYRDSSKNCDMYGRLYSWDAATKVCPEGWRLPDTTDWTILFDAVGGKAQAATRLKATTSWTKNDDGNEDDAFGFSVFAAGSANESGSLSYQGKGNSASFWTSVKGNNNIARSVGMYWDDSYPTINENPIASRHSVRCIKGEPSSSSSVNSSSSSVKSSSSSAEPSSSYVPPSGISYGKMTDPRTPLFSYRTVEIGDRTWMAENMAWQKTNSFCYDENTHNCEIYGRLYVWGDAKNLCPEGWSLPSKEEWEQLILSVGGANQAGKALKTNSGWKNDGNGTDKNGFSALPAGYWSNYSSNGGYYGLEGAAHFWSATATESGSNLAYGLKLEFNVDSASMSDYFVTGGHYYALSVRCILDENYFVDNRDGKTYRMVKIGDQTWMAQNLNYKTDDSYCYGENNAQTTNKYCETYGRLYKIRKSLEMAGGVCPGGWHVPSYDEWQTLFDAVGGKNSAAIHLKSKSDWKEDDYDDDVDSRGTDDYGFSALPGGQRFAGTFTGRDENAWFLSSTTSKTSGCSGCKYIINFVYSLPSAAFGDGVEETAVSVRCLKDAE